jgi:DNA polymerase-3 subunit alpha
VRVGGLISTLQLKRSKKDNRPWAIFTLEDHDHGLECLAFADAYAECGAHLAADTPVFVEGFVSHRDAEASAKIIVSKVIPIDQVPVRFTKEVLLGLNEGQADAQTLERLKGVLARFPGDTAVVLRVGCASGEYAFIETSRRYWVTFASDLVLAMREVLGEVWLKANPVTDLPVRERRNWDHPGPQLVGRN